MDNNPDTKTSLPTDLGGWQHLAPDAVIQEGDIYVKDGEPAGWASVCVGRPVGRTECFGYRVYRKMAVAKPGDLDADHHHKGAAKEPSYTEEARRLVLGDRNSTYGNPADDYAKTAKVWSGLLVHKLKPGQEITPKEAMLMMAALKLCREMHQHKADNLIDAVGYIICAEWAIKGEKPQ